jgi:hypothetical protein
MMRAIILAGMLSLVACSSAGWPNGSVVQGVSQDDAKVLAPEISAYLLAALPSHSTVALDTANPDPIAFVLIPQLQNDGFVRADGGHQVKYVADPTLGGLLLRISIDSSYGANRFFVRNTDGHLQPGGPLTVAVQ